MQLNHMMFYFILQLAHPDSTVTGRSGFLFQSLEYCNVGFGVGYSLFLGYGKDKDLTLQVNYLLLKHPLFLVSIERPLNILI